MWRPAHLLIALSMALVMGTFALASPALAHANAPTITAGLDPADPVGDHDSTGTATHCSFGAGCTFIILNDGSIRALSEAAPRFRAPRSHAHAGPCLPPAAPPPKFAA